MRVYKYDNNGTENPVLKDLEEKILKHFKIKLEEDGDRSDYELESGCYHNGKWLSVGEILDLMRELDSDYDYMFD